MAIDGPPWPITVTATPAAGNVSFVVAGAPNQGFLLALAPAGVLSTGGLPTAVGLVDLDISSGLSFVLDGLFGNTHTGLEPFATTGPSGVATWAIPFPSCGTVHFGGLQVLVADPASAFGFTATAATDLTITSSVTSAVYVSSTTGVAGAPGTQTMPVASIAEGIALALASGFPFPQVRVAIGVYQEAPSFPQLACVVGGYDPVTWAPIPGMRSFVDVGQSTATAVGVLAPTVISGLEFSAPSAIAPNLSSIAFRVEGGTGFLRFENCRFVAHDGAPGAPGAGGQSGAAGTAGGNGISFIWAPVARPGRHGPFARRRGSQSRSTRTGGRQRRRARGAARSVLRTGGGHRRRRPVGRGRIERRRWWSRLDRGRRMGAVVRRQRVARLERARRGGRRRRTPWRGRRIELRWRARRRRRWRWRRRSRRLGGIRMRVRLWRGRCGRQRRQRRSRGPGRPRGHGGPG